MTMTNMTKANIIAALVPAAMLAGALGFEHLAGLHPCEMCMWQRWPHCAALAIACLAFMAKDRARWMLVVIAACCIAVSGILGFYHAGVELKIFTGHTACTMPIGAMAGGDFLDSLMKMPITRCDEPAWSMLGISMAGWNGILSTLGAIATIIILGVPKWRHER